jgi:hypothetical protein
MRRIATFVVLVLALAACTGGDDGAFEMADGETMRASADTSGPLAAEDVAPGTIEVSLETSDKRLVIRHANLELEADDTRALFELITQMTEHAGGYISDATVYPVEGDEEQPFISMSLRLPADQLNATLNAIKDGADEVISESQDAQDVTEQYVDLNAQLTNLEALETELRALLTEVREQPGADPDKLLRVFNEVATVRGQIEQIKGQLQYLDDVVALATVSVQLVPTDVVTPIVDTGWEPLTVARDALTKLVDGLQVLADWGIRFAVFGLPMLLITIGVPLLVGFWVYRRWRRRNTVGSVATSDS